MKTDTFKKLIALSILAFSCSLLKAQNIYTIAGDGVSGYSGDGLQATVAELMNPIAVALDTQGNIYIADNQNNRIRKVTISTGIITTVAGNGTQCTDKDDSAISATYGVAVDINGNIYISDGCNSVIWKATISTGIMSVVVGNGTAGYNGDDIAARSAEIRPEGIALDSNGNIYIADYGNSRIRKVDVSTGIITTIAGDGLFSYSGDGGPATSASLYLPEGVALDRHGDIYIADTYNNRIRKITASTGIITTIAGDSVQGYSGDTGPATSAELYHPSGVAIDESGNIYITDMNNNRLRMVKTNGVINTIAGNGTGGYNGDNIPATSAELYNPFGVAVDINGNIYIADNYNVRVREMNLPTGINELSSLHNIKVYPVPSSGKFTFQLGITNEKLGIEVYNVLGEKIYSQYSIPNTQYQLDLSNEPSGIYLYRLVSENGDLVSEGKVIKE